MHEGENEDCGKIIYSHLWTKNRKYIFKNQQSRKIENIGKTHRDKL